MNFKEFRSCISHLRWAPGIVFLLALILRLVHMFQMSASPLFSAPAVDAGTYTEQAASLAAGNWLGRGEGPFWQPPLYPYFLGLIKLVFPESFFYASRFLQALAGSFSCLLLYLIGQRLFRPAIGFTSGIIAAVYGPLIYFDARLLPAGLAALLTLVSLLLLMRAVERPAKTVFLAAGLAMGMACIAVATLLPLIPAVAVWLFYWLRKNARLGFGHIGPWVFAFLLGAMLAIAPVTLRNYIIGGDTVLISYNGGVNFYIGNNRDYEQTLNLRPGWEWEQLISLPLRQDISLPSDKSRFFYARAVDYIRQSPFDYAGLLSKKTAHFWQGDERERNQEIYYWRKYSTVLATTLWKWGVAFPFGLLSPLALIGLLVYIRRQGMSLPVVFLLTYSIAVIVFFATARYRIPIVPLLILFAANGAFWLYGIWRQKPVVPALLNTAVVGLLVMLVNWDLPPMDMQGRAATHNDLGNTYLRQGRHAMALLKYEQAVRRDSTYWQAWLNLGTLYAMRGDLRGAVPIFKRVLEHHPERAGVWSNLAGAYVGLGEYQRAVQVLEQAIEIPPPQANTYAELIRLYLYRQQYDKADKVYHRALLEFPDDLHLRSLHDTIGH